MLKTDVNIVLFEVGRSYGLLHNLYNIAQCTPIPPLGEAVYEFDVFVAGGAKVNEPFVVEQSRRLLHQRNPPSVVVDQVVIGGEDLSNLVLSVKGR